MGRPREFDTDAALAAAMRVFWTKGYDGTSLDDLLTAMKIGRGSLYKAFSDKRTLYRAALALYDRSVVDSVVKQLRDRTASGCDRVSQFLHSIADAVRQGVDPPGCFLCNASVDQAPTDAAIMAATSASLRRLEAAIGAALSDCIPAVDADRHRAESSRMVADYIGLRVLARSGHSADQLHQMADDIVGAIAC